MLPMPPVEERTIGVNEARSISRILSSYILSFKGFHVFDSNWIVWESD